MSRNINKQFWRKQMEGFLLLWFIYTVFSWVLFVWISFLCIWKQFVSFVYISRSNVQQIMYHINPISSKSDEMLCLNCLSNKNNQISWPERTARRFIIDGGSEVAPADNGAVITNLTVIYYSTTFGEQIWTRRELRQTLELSCCTLDPKFQPLIRLRLL